MLARPRLRQLDLGELLDESFRLYRSNFLTFVAIAALILVPYGLVSLVAQYPLQAQIADLQNQTTSGANPFAQQSLSDLISEMLFWYVGMIIVNLLYAVIFQPLLEGALAYTISQRYLGHERGVGEGFGAAVRHSPALIGARLIPVLVGVMISGAIIAVMGLIVAALVGRSLSDSLDSGSLGLIVGVGMLAFMLIGVVALVGLALLVRILFTSQVIMVEGAGPWQSLVRSWRLTQGSFWRIVGYMLLIALLMYLLAALPMFVLSFAMSIIGLDQRVQLIITTCTSTVISVIVTPFSVIAYTLLYFDLRVRREGFDLEQQANALLGPGLGWSFQEPLSK
jgi:hypothetical protein